MYYTHLPTADVENIDDLGKNLARFTISQLKEMYKIQVKHFKLKTNLKKAQIIESMVNTGFVLTDEYMKKVTKKKTVPVGPLGHVNWDDQPITPFMRLLIEIEAVQVYMSEAYFLKILMEYGYTRIKKNEVFLCGPCFVYQPDGTQRTPDFWVFENGTSNPVIKVELKSSCKGSMIFLNDGTFLENHVYITNVKQNGCFMTYIHLGDNVMREEERELRRFIDERIESIKKEIKIKLNEFPQLHGFKSRYLPNPRKGDKWNVPCLTVAERTFNMKEVSVFLNESGASYVIHHADLHPLDGCLV